MLTSLHIAQLVDLVERKILDMSGEAHADEREIALLKSCRERLLAGRSLSGAHLERLIDLVEIALLRGADEGTSERVRAKLVACRQALLDLAAQRSDVRVIPFPTELLARGPGETREELH